MRKFWIILLTVTALNIVQAQEFRCTVSINSQKLLSTQQAYDSGGDKKVFDNMKTAIEDFINGRHWTNIEFEHVERLDCSLTLVLSERSSATDFKGQISIQLRRPVYNSSYTTGLFNYIESGNFIFSFNESQPLEFDPNTYFSNLSSTLAYYCYIMLGYYFDSFSPNGGQPFFEMALTIQQTAEQQPGAEKSWTSDIQKARYWFMENHTNSAYAKLHDVYYRYHRLGLDMMTKDQKQARANIIQSLKDLQEVHKTRSGLLSTQQFIDVKIAEIVSIFTPAPPEEQKEVYLIIKDISPINITKLKDFNTK